MTLRQAAILLLILTAGCERPHSDMGKQDKYLPGQSSEFFADGKSARPMVAGVVPRDDADVPGYPYALHISDSTELAPANASAPFPITSDVLAQGQQQFETYCAVCHGRLGNGQGMIVQRGFTRPPSFHIDRLRTAPDSHLYNVIAHGYGAMFSYAERVPPHERWEIVAYIRALQMAPDAVGSSLPAIDRQALIAGGDRKTPGAAGGGG
ncbi:MAG TPA: cytochrome c [Tepidisphaeraceae bacterium]|jgi:mono/diheme cytochrome c family protein|nr:cytochrome c [Tepidisphaeraceae bacterium]